MFAARRAQCGLSRPMAPIPFRSWARTPIACRLTYAESDSRPPTPSPAPPERLREVDGIGPVRAASIVAAWAEQKAVREIMAEPDGHGKLNCAATGYGGRRR